MGGDTIYRNGNRWQAIRYNRWKSMAVDTIEMIGTDGRRYDRQEREWNASDRVYRDGNWRQTIRNIDRKLWQAIRYTELRTDCRQ